MQIEFFQVDLWCIILSGSFSFLLSALFRLFVDKKFCFNFLELLLQLIKKLFYLDQGEETSKPAPFFAIVKSNQCQEIRVLRRVLSHNLPLYNTPAHFLWLLVNLIQNNGLQGVKFFAQMPAIYFG